MRIAYVYMYLHLVVLHFDLGCCNNDMAHISALSISYVMIKTVEKNSSAKGSI